MQPTSSSGPRAYWDFTPSNAISNTYYFTLPDGPGNLKRLQIDNNGDINMVPASFSGKLVSLRITEVSENQEEDITNHIAIGKPTSQSSTTRGGVSSRAVDANADGNYKNGSVTQTTNQANSWWRVDLENVYDLSTIKIHNRTNNCCADRINGAELYVGNTNSTNPNDYTLIGTLNDITVNSFTNLNISAQYVMVRHPGTQVLNLAEVEVHGSLNTKLDQSNIAISIAPNPAKDYINITVENFDDQNVEYLISSLQGQIVSTGSINTNYGEATPVDVSSLQNGIYFIYLKSDNKRTAAHKMVIMR